MAIPARMISSLGLMKSGMPDPKDIPILNAAIIAGVDIIISGDRHFLELDLEQPKTMKAAEYLDYVEAEE